MMTNKQKILLAIVRPVIKVIRLSTFN